MVSAKTPEIRLRHVLENIDGILAATTGMTTAEVMRSFVLMRAVERAIQVTSEAAKELLQEMRALQPDVPWQDIIRIGNILRHEHYRIRKDLLRSTPPRHPVIGHVEPARPNGGEGRFGLLRPEAPPPCIPPHQAPQEEGVAGAALPPAASGYPALPTMWFAICSASSATAGMVPDFRVTAKSSPAK
jgi:uncharacterized protein with HEPN domain